MASDITEIIGIYDADSTLLGEVSYWVKARFGKAHCSLCDLTHGLFKVKGEWLECTRSVGVPVSTYHRNDAPEDVLAVASAYPVLVVRRANGLQVVADGETLSQFEGRTTEFGAWLEQLVR